MADQVDEATIDARHHDLLELTNAIIKEKLDALIGANVEVLCEGPSKNNPRRLTGRTRGNKIVLFEGDERLIGQGIEVRVERTSGFCLYGAPV